MNELNSGMSNARSLASARTLRNRAAPIVVWFVVVLTLLIWRQTQVGQFTGVGWVESKERSLSPAVDGLLSSIPVGLLDQVEAGTIVAIFDDAVITAELTTAQAELGRMRLEVRAAENLLRGQSSAGREALQVFGDEQDARLTYLEAVVRTEAEAVELDRLNREKVRISALHADGLASESEFDAVRLRSDELQIELAHRQDVLEAARQYLAEAEDRRRAYEVLHSETKLEEYLDPVREQLTVQAARISEIQQRRERLVLRAPVDGQIVQVFRRAGETARAGEPVLALAELRNPRVLAYVDGTAAERIGPGSVAKIVSMDRPGRSATARVHRVGQILRDIPRSLQSNPLATSTGIPVLIAGLPVEAFLPGERLQVSVRSLSR